METPGERLKHARIAAGFSSARAASNALEVPYETYSQHENGTRGYRADSAEKYARRYRVSAEYLLYGRGTGPSDELPSTVELESMLFDVLQEIPATATIGDWPRLAAPILRVQLEQYQADRAASDKKAEATSPGKGAQSRPATKPTAVA